MISLQFDLKRNERAFEHSILSALAGFSSDAIENAEASTEPKVSDAEKALHRLLRAA